MWQGAAPAPFTCFDCFVDATGLSGPSKGREGRDIERERERERLVSVSSDGRVHQGPD